MFVHEGIHLLMTIKLFYILSVALWKAIFNSKIHEVMEKRAEIFYIWLNVELFWVTKSFCVDSVLEIVLFRF